MSTSIKKPLQQKIEGSRKIQKRTDDEGENDAVAGKKQHQQEQGVATSSEGENRGEVDQRLEDSDSKLSHFSSTAPLTTSDYQSSTYETLPEAASVSDGGDVEKKIRPSDLLDFVDSALSENDHRLSERSSDPEGDSRNTDNSGSSSSSEDASTQDVLNEMNGVRDDIRIKQAASYAVTGSRLTAFPIDNEDDKMHLAKRISVVGTVVETPGAFSCDGEGNPLFKLSQDQLVHMGRLRHEQKKREATEDRNDAAFTVLNYNDDEDMIFEDDVVLDDIQARMHAFQNASNQEAEVQATKRSVNEQRKRRIRWAIVMIVVLLVVGISVGVFIGAQGSKKENDLPSLTPSFAPTLFDRNECYFATNDAEMTMRYLQMRSILALEFPILKVVIDTAGSDSRKVLCWLSDFDSLRIDASVVSEYDLLQRFALALIHYQVVPISGSLDDTLESTRWLSGDHECSWSFVSCNGTENVVLVDFGVIGATGTIPSELALLTKLLYVDFSTYSSSFRGTIPSELWSMDQLQVLNFGANSLTGTLSNDLKKLSDLRIFKVDQNLLSGTIPTEIGELTKLRILSLWENIDIGGAAPDLSALTNLEVLRLGDVACNGPFPKYLYLFPRLRILELYGTLMTGSISSDITKLSDLEHLNLSSSPFSGTIATELGNLSSLSNLDFHRMARLTGTMPSELGQLSKLTLLRSDDTSLTGTMPPEICVLRSISLAELTAALCGRFECGCCGGNIHVACCP